ncbi:pentatricopeptide repeat-containing protein At4g02750 [Selaginella moellendorffii]|uniref:pentatricopeptide repeat-containing protein At4g02750 n=1 Tax=Selaginella moellendorffii TaxID=88036 RepID=UPI000D1C5BC9|nr:pentatricopeptide repeat-containing protein At4g02750 [Selaginella moellendorffii]|eukprot:XP_024535930.1 pentatricopeptide repeat-containing protein At4g02750 [Selaginella moellendorffii]
MRDCLCPALILCRGNVMLAKYARDGYLESSWKDFNAMGERSVASWTSIIQPLAELGKVELAQNIYDRMPIWNVITSTLMIAAYAQRGHFDLALGALIRCRRSMWLHRSNKMALGSSSSCAALVELYTLTGLLMEARQLIERMLQVDIASWNMLLAGYYCDDAKRTFDGIFSRNEPCRTCSSSCHYFMSMLSDYELAPVAEHFSCVIDPLGRVGLRTVLFCWERQRGWWNQLQTWTSDLGLDLEHRPVPRGGAMDAHCARVLSCITTCGNSTDSMGHYIATVLGSSSKLRMVEGQLRGSL